MATFYTIVDVTQQDDSLITTVVFDVDGTEIKVAITHFQPRNVAEVIQGIINRSASETVKLTAKDVAAAIVPQLTLSKAIEIV